MAASSGPGDDDAPDAEAVASNAPQGRRRGGLRPVPAQPSGRAIGLGERRSAARLGAVQALYQMDLVGKGLNEVLAEFEAHWLGREIEGDRYKPADAGTFRSVVQGVLDRQQSLDPAIDRVLADGWPLARIEMILRAILRAGAFELFHRLDIPPKVVISEYVAIARAFFEREETAMANAVLDRLAREARGDGFGRPLG